MCSKSFAVVDKDVAKGVIVSERKSRPNDVGPVQLLLGVDLILASGLADVVIGHLEVLG